MATGLLQYTGFACQAELEPVDLPNAAVIRQGSGEISSAGEELRHGPGTAFLMPADRSSATVVNAVSMATLQVPWTAAGALAEEWTGMPSAELRFAAMAPVSTARQRATTAAGVARRWGWASFSQFNLAYLRRFGKLPLLSWRK